MKLDFPSTPAVGGFGLAGGATGPGVQEHVIDVACWPQSSAAASDHLVQLLFIKRRSKKAKRRLQALRTIKAKPSDPCRWRRSKRFRSCR